MRKTCIFVLLLFVCRLCAQPATNFASLTVEEGLSQGMVFDILQSQDGFLWIATKDGINRYDGYRFEVFSPDAFDPFSIGSGEIRKLHEDSRGWLWLAYFEGIDVFDPGSGRFFHLPVKFVENFSGYQVSFWEDVDGTMWVSWVNGLLKIKYPVIAVLDAMKHAESFPEFEYSVIHAPRTSSHTGEDVLLNSVFRTEEGSLLVTTTQGIHTLNEVEEKINSRPIALSGFDLSYFGEDDEGRMWFSSDTMVCCIKKIQEQPDFIRTTIKNNRWLLDASGNIWGREGRSLMRWRPADLIAGKLPQLSLKYAEEFPQSEVFDLTTLLIDRSGIAWTGTNGYGLLKQVTEKPKFHNYKPLTSKRNIYEDPSGNIFTISSPDTIYADYHFVEGRPNPWFSKLAKNLLIKFLVYDDQGNCWFNVQGRSIGRIDEVTKDINNFEVESLGIWYTRQGRLLTLTEKGLLEFDAQKEMFQLHEFNKPLPWGYDILERYFLWYEGRDGTLWIAAYDGLLKASPSDQGYRFERFINTPSDHSSLSNNLVLSIAEDPLEPKRYLWVGTKGGGLNRLDLQTGSFRHFGLAQGLPDKVIYGILPDEAGHLWLSTNKGLCRFSSRDFLTKNFIATDGLQSNEFNQGSFLKTRDGHMIFGGVNGLTVFHPDSLRFNEQKPAMAITRILVNNNVIGISETQRLSQKKTGKDLPGRLMLSHRENLLKLEFSALDFTNPPHNQYRYLLKKHSIFGRANKDEWVDLSHNHNVQFANLQPGRYTFFVLGTNNDGIWSELPAIFEFTIRPPWWAAWWAWLLYALAFGIGAWIVHRDQLRQRLESQEALRLRELDEFKNSFFTNITHEFRTPLTVILGMAELVEPEVGQETKPKIGLIRRNGENLLRLINQILDLTKLESDSLGMNYIQGDVSVYLRYIVESLHSLASAQHVTMKVECQDTEIVIDYDPERLLQIVYNLLSNAIKFTPEGGKVLLRAGLQNFEGFVNFELSVSDTGVGIPPDDLPYIFDRFYQAKNLQKAKAGGTGIGLALTKELVKAMDGSISVESKVGLGTTFTLNLPVSNKAAYIDDATRRHPIAPSATPLIEEMFSNTFPTLLLIEDNPDVMKYLADCLSPHFALDFAPDGRNGIEKAIETIPDLIISDVMMPEVDGFEVCETLKNDQRSSHIPIVLLTAKAGVENRIAGLRRGADAYLAKPFHREELLVTLDNLLDLRKKLQARYGSMDINPSMSKQLPVDQEDAFVKRVKGTILENLSDADFNVDVLCRSLTMSRPQLHRKLTALTGKNITHYIRSLRLAKAKDLLLSSEMNITEVAFAVGFDDPKYFSRVFAEEFGMPPSKLGKTST